MTNALSKSVQLSKSSSAAYLANAGLFSRPQELKKNSSLPQTPPIFLSKKTSDLWLKGKCRQALDFHYEDLVRLKTGGKSGFIGIYEIDAITERALIQCKRSGSARINPRQFIKNARDQIKRTIKFAKERNKVAEFWFQGGAHQEVQRYIKNQGGIYKSDLDENAYEVSPSLENI